MDKIPREAAELMGGKMVGLLKHYNAAYLQSMVLALACMGVYSPPFDGVNVEVDGDTLASLAEDIEYLLGGPLKTQKECADLFELAVNSRTIWKPSDHV